MKLASSADALLLIDWVNTFVVEGGNALQNAAREILSTMAWLEQRFVEYGAPVNSSRPSSATIRHRCSDGNRSNGHAK